MITKRISETVALRARDLKMDHIHQGIQDKLTVFEEILRQENLSSAEAAFVGDDVIDLPVMRNCGFAIAVANARKEVKAEAHYVTAHGGGDGAARDAVEYILKAQGKWNRVVSEYICERSPKNKSGKLSKGSWRVVRQSLQILKNPPVVCLGRARVDNRWATVSPYSPCCFQESLLHKNPSREKSFACLNKILVIS